MRTTTNLTTPTTIFTATWLTRLSLCFVFSILFTACQLDDPNAIGLGLNSQTDNLGVVYTDTLTLNTSTVLVDSVVANQGNSILVGAINDPQLGKITARNFTQFLYDARTDLGASAVYDSVKLYLYIRRDSTQTTAISQSLTIHSLTGDIDRKKIYYTTDQIAFDPTPIATYTYNRASSVSDGVDSLKIKLDDNVGQAILSAYVNTIAVEDFLTRFKGLAIQTNQSQSYMTAYGQRVIFKDVQYNSRIDVYYHNAGGNTRKTLSVYPSLGGSFNQVTLQGAGKFNTLNKAYDAVSSTETGNVTYVQTGIGLRTKIEIPTLADLRKKGNVLINDARLIVAPITSTVLSNAELPPNQLVLYELDPESKIYRASYTSGTNKLYRYFALNQRLASSFASRQLSGKYAGQYIFDLTEYIQQLLYNNDQVVSLRRPNKGLMLSAPSQTFDSNGQILFDLGENEFSIRGLSLGNRQHPSRPLKLVIYYTEVK